MDSEGGEYVVIDAIAGIIICKPDECKITKHVYSN